MAATRTAGIRSNVGRDLFADAASVIRTLVTYTDCWQPATTSIYLVGGTHRQPFADGLRSGLLDHLEVRDELRRRMEDIEDRDRRILWLWYVRQLSVDEISNQLGISRRQCFRRRANAIRVLVDAEEDGAA
jgi:DNA-directed RNA polymerase specialized sigma24 family protein